MNKKKFFKDFLPVLLIFVLWRFGLFILGILAMRILAFKPSFPYAFDVLAKLSPWQAVWQWANFDGPHYLTIAEKGYVGTGLIQAYFPLYPLLIKYLNLLVGNYLYSGLIISNLAFVAALYFFRQLIRNQRKNNYFFPFAFLLLFPTSFYLGAYYSESLFLLLVILVFLNIHKQKWLKAAIFAGLASATRLVGGFLAPAIIWEYYQSLPDLQKKKAVTWFKTIGLGIVSLFGFIWFCLYLKQNFHDPFYFAKVQNAFGASRQTDKIILLHQVIWRYLKMIYTIKGNNFLFYSISQEFIISLLVLGLLIWGWIKKFRKPYLIYSFCSYFLPTLTGNFSSMPRYVAVIFPIYLILAKFKNKYLKLFILLISFLFLIVNTILFLRGYWIA